MFIGLFPGGHSLGKLSYTLCLTEFSQQHWVRGYYYRSPPPTHTHPHTKGEHSYETFHKSKWCKVKRQWPDAQNKLRLSTDTHTVQRCGAWCWAADCGSQRRSLTGPLAAQDVRWLFNNLPRSRHYTVFSLFASFHKSENPFQISFRYRK